MTEAEAIKLLDVLCRLPQETEWVEFKENNESPEEMGEYISALSNAAALNGKEAAYMVWGVKDTTHEIVGTTFQPRKKKVGHPEKKGNQELESWLLLFLSPNINFHFHEAHFDGKPVVILEIQPCLHTPVRWRETEYIRVGSYKKKLKDYPEKERTLWFLLSRKVFEKVIAYQDASADEVLARLDYPAYFDVTNQPLPSAKAGILEKLTDEGVIVSRINGNYDITNFGAVLFAKRLSDFELLRRKAVRVINYAGTNRVAEARERVFDEGYAAGFESMLAYINDQLPSNEYIGQALRVETAMYPSIAIRELVANAIIHQDLASTGTSPMVEIFTDRVEIANPGKPLVAPLRFADATPKSRNDLLASFMHRIRICEERGSGIDKVLTAVEMFQLPAPGFTESDEYTRVFLYAPRPFSKMSGQERVWACYWHACLLYVSGQQMSNETLRKRLGLEDEQYSQVGRIIADAKKANRIKPSDPENKSPRYARYVPVWA